jgi:pyruvate kinase
MTKSNERHRLSLIIATLGPSTDNEKELITMLMAGIARQWTDGVDIARVLYSDGEDVAKNRIETFRDQSKKRNLSTQVYLDTDEENISLDKYIAFANSVDPNIISFPKCISLDVFSSLKEKLNSNIKISLRLKSSDSFSDLQDYYDHCSYVMIESSSQDIVDNKLVENAKSKDVEPIYLAKMPTLMKGQVQSREENFEIGHTLEEGFDIVALYEETAKGPYPARSVKCIDEIAVESEKLRVNPFADLLEKIMSVFKRKN